MSHAELPATARATGPLCMPRAFIPGRCVLTGSYDRTSHLPPTGHHALAITPRAACLQSSYVPLATHPFEATKECGVGRKKEEKIFDHNVAPRVKMDVGMSFE